MWTSYVFYVFLLFLKFCLIASQTSAAAHSTQCEVLKMHCPTKNVDTKPKCVNSLNWTRHFEFNAKKISWLRIEVVEKKCVEFADLNERTQQKSEWLDKTNWTAYNCIINDMESILEKYVVRNTTWKTQTKPNVWLGNQRISGLILALLVYRYRRYALKYALSNTQTHTNAST